MCQLLMSYIFPKLLSTIVKLTACTAGLVIHTTLIISISNYIFLHVKIHNNVYKPLLSAKLQNCKEQNPQTNLVHLH